MIAVIIHYWDCKFNWKFLGKSLMNWFLALLTKTSQNYIASMDKVIPFKCVFDILAELSTWNKKGKQLPFRYRIGIFGIKPVVAVIYKMIHFRLRNKLLA